MTTSLIVDASVALKWVVGEAHDLRARALYSRAALLIAPDLVIAETANVIWKKQRRGELAPAQAPAALQTIVRSYDELTPSHQLCERALELAVRLEHPTNDCFYLALAEQRSGTLITADTRLLAVLAQSGWTGAYEAL